MDKVSPRYGRKPTDESPPASPSSSQTTPSLWCPSQLAFRPYSSLLETTDRPKALRVVVRRPLVAKLTKHIVETYQICNAEFRYSIKLNLKRFLTSPADGVLNDGLDNENSDLILGVNYVLVNSQTNRRYIVKDILGHGTFGQVAKCWVPETSSFVAVKIIKNRPAYYQQAWVEVTILKTLNKKFDPEDKHHIVRIYDYFVFQRHLCIAFELLNTNLYEIIKINDFRGLSLSILQLISKQILRGLGLLKDAGIIHCDLKPENILLCTSVKPAEIKIIDFGSACMEDRTVYSYIQSRYYRSPEVLLGYQYTTAIDMWSFGCIVAELFLGLPLFPGVSEFDLLTRMIRILGEQPPDYLLKEAKNTSKFFKFVGNVDHVHDGHVSLDGGSAYQALTEEEFEAREKKKPVIGKEYLNYMNLEGIIAAYPYKKNLPEDIIIKERQVRLALVDFLRGLVEFDPAKRWSPSQASKHPFVTGEPFKYPYKPPPETPHLAVSQNFKVDHHPGGGHWFASGLSPNVQGRTVAMHIGSHLQMAPYAHGSSYGSLGSHNSFNDCNELESSYGSCGDNYNAFTYFSPVGPSALNIHAQGSVSVVGASPDARWIPHRPQGLGVSPSAGNFAPLPLGMSPSQLTPPSTFNHVSGSLGHYGSASPARGSCQGSPLGKGVAAGHFNGMKNYSGYLQPQEGPSSSHWQGQFSGRTGFSQGQSDSQVSGGSLHMPFNSSAVSWKQPHRSNLATDCCVPSMPNCFTHGLSMRFLQTTRVAADEKLDATDVPDPGDWDPNYSDELLLQEDSAERSSVASEFSKMVNIDQTMTSLQSTGGIGRYNHDLYTSSGPSVWRSNRPNQIFSKPNVVSSPSVYNLPCHDGHSMTKMPFCLPRLSPTSPSHLDHSPIQQPGHGRLSVINGNEGSRMKLQNNSFRYNPGYPHSPGGRTRSPFVNIPPSCHGRKDYGRIT